MAGGVQKPFSLTRTAGAKGNFVILIFLTLLVAVAKQTLGFQAPTRAPLTSFDKRVDVLKHSNVVTEEQRRAADHLRQVLPHAQIDFDPLTGSPRRVSAPGKFLPWKTGQDATVSSGTKTGPSRVDPYLPTKTFLREHRQLFGYGPELLEAARVKREFVTAHSGMRTVVWEQQIEGIEVFEALLISHTTRENELVNLSSQLVPASAIGSFQTNPARQQTPGVTAREAVAVAARNIGETLVEQDLLPLENGDTRSSGWQKRQAFAARALNGSAEARLIWLPMSRTHLSLCWDVILTSRSRGEMFRVLVDTRTGEPMLRHCLTDYISDASYRVYTSDSPTPFSPGYGTPTSQQPPAVARQFITLSALSTNASPAGWISDGVNETRGNNVDAHTDHDNDDQPDLPRPQGSSGRTFDFPLDLTQSPATYANAAVVQLFYWNNFMHDQLYDLGFTEAAGNFQNDNFGRGGSGNDAVMADAQDGGGYNNANFSTPPDGYPPRMQMYQFNGPTPNRDGDLDAEIILHEYTHGLSNRRVGGGVGLRQLVSGGLGEGWSDFYALSLLSQPADDLNGVYAAGGYAAYLLGGFSQNYYFGIRRYPYCTDLRKAPLTFKDIDPHQASDHPGVPRNPVTGTDPAEVHNMGEVWCAALWDLRANLVSKLGWSAGNHLALQLVTDGMNLSPPNPNFLEARDAIIQADLVNSGGVNLRELWVAFAKRGMGYSATAPESSTSTGVSEAYDLPLTITVPAEAAEGDGVLVAAGNVQLLFPATTNLVFELSSSDSSVLTVPASISIPAGMSNATFDVTIVDDSVLDGTQSAYVTATTAGYGARSPLILVYDNETAALHLLLPASVTEGQETVGSVQIDAIPGKDILVQLSSSDTTEIRVPPSVIIPAGQTSADFTLSALEDNQFDGSQPVSITAHVPNWSDGAASITVLDNRGLTVTLPGVVWESDNVLTNSGRVAIHGALAQNLDVFLSSSMPAKLQVSPSVTIPAGQLSATFDLTVINNSILDSNQIVIITATAPGFTNGSASLRIMDDDLPPAPANPQPVHASINVPMDTYLQWDNGRGGELVSNGGFETPGLPGGPPPYWDTSYDGFAWWVLNNGTYDPDGPDGPATPFQGKFSLLGWEHQASTLKVQQSFYVPGNVPAVTLGWVHKVRNHFVEFNQEQQFSVELRDTNDNILAVPYATKPGDPLLQEWTSHTFDLLPLAGKTIRLAFQLNALDYYLNVHLDNVSAFANGFPGLIASDIYFGTNPNPGPAEYLGTTTNSYWNLPSLAPLTTYYWRIVARASGATNLGPVWQFHTTGEYRFVWDPISPEQYTGQPFPVRITARNALDQTVTNLEEIVRLGATNDPILLAPTNVIRLTNGTWSGSLAVQQRATNLVLRADDDAHHTGLSAPLNILPFHMAPVLLQQPTNQVLLAGESAGFYSVADGTLPLAYQWNFNSTNIPGATNSFFILMDIQERDAGSYTVLVTNEFGRILSSEACLILTTSLPPTIVVQPLSATNLAGSTVAFNVTCRGSPPLSYRWASNGVALMDGGNVSGAGTATLRLTNIGSADCAEYTVVVTNTFGATTSSPANLVLATAPRIVANPTSLTNLVHTTARFSVSALGTPPLAFQWVKNGMPLSDGSTVNGAKSPTLILSDVSENDIGDYMVLLQSPYGSAASSTCSLMVVRSMVVAWGYDFEGDTRVPPGLTNVIAVAAGASHSLVLMSDGSLKAWGYNRYGQGSVPPGLTNVVAIASGGDYNLALRNDGAVAAWGDNSYGQLNVPASLTGVVAIAAGIWMHSLALKSDGSVVAWGDNSQGQTNVPSGLSNVVAVAGGALHSLVLRGDGTVVAWGNYNRYGEATVPPGLGHVVAVAAGAYHNLALTSDGMVTAWGANFKGQTTVPLGLKNVVAVDAGWYSSAALRADGTLVLWGWGVQNVPVDLTNVIAIAYGPSSSSSHILALEGDGPPPIHQPLDSFRRGFNSFSLSLPTRSGKVYALEYKNSLQESDWSAFPLTFGTGGTRTITDPAATNSVRFYRIREW